MKPSDKSGSPHGVDTKNRVLVVDDNRDSADLLALVLQSAYETKTAYDGRSALATAEEWRPRVVILDIGLPDMNGYDVARALRDPRHAPLALIALTGWGSYVERQKAMDAGFDLLLIKPVDAGALEAAIEQLVRPR